MAETAYDLWRDKVLDLLYQQISIREVSPETSFFHEACQFDLLGRQSFAHLSCAPTDFKKNQLRQSKLWTAYEKICRQVLCHRDDIKFYHLYRLLLKMYHGLEIINDPLDEDVKTLELMAKQISRDCHKMHAFVRFKEINTNNKAYYIAYHEPDHFILKRNITFFKERFSTIDWVIISPYAMIAWNGKRTFYREGSFDRPDLPNDPVENLWKTYFAHIFNPARVKIKAMKNEMPTRYWKNMPETDLIPDLIRNASSIVEQMRLQSVQNRKSVADFLPHKLTNQSLQDASEKCQACDLCEGEPIWGYGRPSAVLALVFSRPLSKTVQQHMEDALKRAGFDVDKIYYTQSLKHTSQIKRLSSLTSQAMTCRRWLMEELGLVKPITIICFGRLAIHSVFGLPIQITQSKYKSPLCQSTFIAQEAVNILNDKNAFDKIFQLSKEVLAEKIRFQNTQFKTTRLLPH